MITLIHKQIIAMVGYYACGAFINLLIVDMQQFSWAIKWLILSERSVT